MLAAPILALLALAAPAADLDALVDALPPAWREVCVDADGKLQVDPAVLELTRCVRAGERLNGAQWQRALANARVVELPRTWVADEPLFAALRVPSWLEERVRITATPRHEGFFAARAGNVEIVYCATGARESHEAQLYRELGSLPEGEHRLELDVRVERGRWGYGAPPELLWSGVFARDVRVVADLDAIAPPVSSPAIDAAVRRAVRARLPNGLRPRVLSVGLSLEGELAAALAGVGLSLELELLRDGEVVELASFPVFDSNAPRSCASEGRTRVAEATLTQLAPAAYDDEAERARYTLRVRGSAGCVPALRWSHARWAGTVELPLAEALARESR